MCSHVFDPLLRAGFEEGPLGPVGPPRIPVGNPCPKEKIITDDTSPQEQLDEDDWRRSMVLLGSCSEDEFLDPDLHSNALLIRLFHEEGVRAFTPQIIRKDCRCSEEKVINVLCMMPLEDRDYMEEEGSITMHCEFCGHDYIFARGDIEKEVEVRKLEG